MFVNFNRKALAQASMQTWTVESLPGSTAAQSVWPLATADPGGEATVKTHSECLVMKRPGKPDTGNPFVRFDEERGGSTELTTTVCSIRHLPLRLLYLNFFVMMGG